MRGAVPPLTSSSWSSADSTKLQAYSSLKRMKICEVWGSRGGYCEDYYLLGRDTVMAAPRFFFNL
jgi:hypothetical protein